MQRQITVEILCIGNELLIGKIQDTNSHWLCTLVNERGGYVTRVTLLRDRTEEIATAVRDAIEREVDILFTSGGLGPTIDDVTLAAVSIGAGVTLKLNQTALHMVEESYDAFARQGILTEGGLNAAREKMAWQPEGGEPLDNPVGTAPGVLLKVGRTAIISLPGVSSELKAIVTRSLDQFLKDTFGQGGALSKTICVRCNDESIMEPVLSRVVADHPEVYIKSLATTLGKFPEIDITLTVTGKDADDRTMLIDAALRDLRDGLTAIGIVHRNKESA